MIMEMCVVIRYGLIIRGYLPIVTHFGYLFVFAVLVLSWKITYQRKTMFSLPQRENQFSCETILMTMAISLTCNFMQIKLHFYKQTFCTRTRFETETEGNSEISYCRISILLFRKRLSVKSARDNPERYCRFFKFHGFKTSAFQDNLRK